MSVRDRIIRRLGGWTAEDVAGAQAEWDKARIAALIAREANSKLWVADGIEGFLNMRPESWETNLRAFVAELHRNWDKHRTEPPLFRKPMDEWWKRSTEHNLLFPRKH